MWPHMSSSLLFHSFFLFCFYNYMLSSHCRERRASGEGRRERHEGGGEIVGPADVGGAAALSSRREGGKGAAVHGVGVRRKGRGGVTPRGDWWERAARRPAGEDQRRTLARRVGGRGTAAHAAPPERSTNRSAAKVGSELVRAASERGAEVRGGLRPAGERRRCARTGRRERRAHYYKSDFFPWPHHLSPPSPSLPPAPAFLQLPLPPRPRAVRPCRRLPRLCNTVPFTGLTVPSPEARRNGVLVDV